MLFQGDPKSPWTSHDWQARVQILIEEISNILSLLFRQVLLWEQAKWTNPMLLIHLITKPRSYYSCTSFVSKIWFSEITIDHIEQILIIYLQLHLINPKKYINPKNFLLIVSELVSSLCTKKNGCNIWESR